MSLNDDPNKKNSTLKPKFNYSFNKLLVPTFGLIYTPEELEEMASSQKEIKTAKSYKSFSSKVPNLKPDSKKNFSINIKTSIANSPNNASQFEELQIEKDLHSITSSDNESELKYQDVHLITPRWRKNSKNIFKKLHRIKRKKYLKTISRVLNYISVQKVTLYLILETGKAKK